MTEAERAELLAEIEFLALKLAGALQQSQARSEIMRARKEEQ